MTWAFKRQFFYVSVLLIFFALLGFLVSYPYLNKPPTCFDSKQNGDEKGVDCGGSCALACIFEVDKLSVFWARAFEIVPGRYNAVAYLENQNINTAIHKIKYKFRFADKNNIYIGKREGETSIPTAGTFAIFEPAVDLGNSIPVYTSFEFTEVPIWVKVSKEKIDQLKIFISDIKLENEKESPTLSALIENQSLFMIPDVNVVTILYDYLGNAISASRTYFELLKGEEVKRAYFTWPLPFDTEVVTKEIIPMYDIFSVKLK
jgi:hypothetical protein